MIIKYFLLNLFLLMFMESEATNQCRLLLTCGDSTPAAFQIESQTRAEVGSSDGGAGASNVAQNCSENLRNAAERLSALESTVNELLGQNLPGVEETESTERTAISSSTDQTAPSISCSDNNKNGVQTDMNGERVFCDNGWIVFQRRFNGSESFNRNWSEYKMGFGNLEGEFWLGLDRIHEYTKNGGCELRVDLWDFNDSFAFSEYRSFLVESEQELYRLYANGYNGTAGDSIFGRSIATDKVHNNLPFSTKDRDNDGFVQGNCAETYRSGWWFNLCFKSALNNPWGRTPTGGAFANIVWESWRRWTNPIKSTAMKLRCNN